jgi:hypothetical protein
VQLTPPTGSQLVVQDQACQLVTHRDTAGGTRYQQTPSNRVVDRRCRHPERLGEPQLAPPGYDGHGLDGLSRRWRQPCRPTKDRVPDVVGHLQTAGHEGASARLVSLAPVGQAGGRAGGEAMPNYRIVYGDDEQVVRETFTGVELQREDGWLVIFRGKDAILRAREEHVQSIEELDEPR